MLSFVFAALVALLDQLFKHWITVTLVNLGDTRELVPGVIRLTHWRNSGIALGIFDGFGNIRWPLVGVTFICVIILVFILLRYNEGFWGTLGLSAVLGGAVGNLIDRVFRGGSVVDMFQLQFTTFAIFNIADIFITLGAVTFILFFIISSFKSRKEENELVSAPTEPEIIEYEDRNHGIQREHMMPSEKDVPKEMKPVLVLHPEPEPEPEPEPARSPPQDVPAAGISADNMPKTSALPELSPQSDVSSLLEELGTLEMDLTQTSESDDQDMDKLLREYGFENIDS